MIIHETSNLHVKYSMITFVLAWSALVILMSMFVTVPLTSDFAQDLQISETSAAWIGSVFSICYAIFCLIYGPLSDIYGRKIFLVWGTLTLSVITFITGFVHQYQLLLIMRGLQGVAAAAVAPIILVYASDVFPSHKRLAVTGYITTGYLMAGIVAQVFGMIISANFGWQFIFITLGIIYFITAILVIVYLPKDPVPDRQSSILSMYVQMKDLFKNLKLCISFYITFTLYLSLIGMYTILGGYLQSEPFEYTDNEILLVRAIAIISILTSAFAGRAADKIGIIKLLRITLALAATSLLLMGISTSDYLIILCSLLFVAGIAIVVPVNASLVIKNAGSARGSAVSFNAFVLFLGASIGPVLATGLMQGDNYLIAFVIFSSFIFIGLITAFILKSEG